MRPGGDRTREKADEIDAEGAERRGERVLVRKEQLAEDEAGHRAVEKKIVPLDRYLPSPRRRRDEVREHAGLA